MAAAQDIVGYKFHRSFYADAEGRFVLINGEPLSVPLTLKEYEVLEFFLTNSGRVITRESIEPLDKPPSGRHPADNYLSRIAGKLGLNKKELFRSRRGIGYSLEGDVQPIRGSDQKEGGDLFKASELNFNTHTVDSMRASLKLSLRALEFNPQGLPEAHVTAAYDYINLSMAAYSAELPEKVIPEARHHAMAAFKINPRSSRALGVLGLISMIYDYDWEHAEKQLESALELNPDDWATLLSYAHMLIGKARFDDAVREVEKASRINPTDLIVHASVGWLHLLAGDIEGAIKLGSKSTSFYPSFAPAQMMLGWAHEAAKHFPEARRQYEISLGQEYSPVALASLGHLEAKCGNRRKGIATLKELNQLHQQGRISYIPGYCKALIFAGLNETEECLNALDEAYEQHCDWLIHLAVEPRWDAIRSCDRFRRLITKVGVATLPDQTRSARG